MVDRDWQDSDYVRIYQSIRDDPKFDTVRDDDRALAAYVRLLMDAEPVYPARASIPAHLRSYARDVLVKAGILQIIGRTYTISGLRKERESRALSGAERSQRWRDRLKGRQAPGDGAVTPTVTARDDDVTLRDVDPVTLRAGAGASASVSYSESSSSTEGGAGGNKGKSPLMEAVAYIEARTRRPWVFGQGSKVWDTLEPDVRDFGWPAVRRAMEAEKTPFPDVGQLVFGASRRLHPISGPDKPSEPDPEYVAQQLAERRKARGHA